MFRGPPVDWISSTFTELSYLTRELPNVKEEISSADEPFSKKDALNFSIYYLTKSESASSSGVTCAGFEFMPESDSKFIEKSSVSLSWMKLE